MRCVVCKKGPIDGVTIYRQNPKGQAGIWACEAHRVMSVDPQVREIVDAIEGKRP